MTDEPTTVHDEDLAPEEDKAEEVTGGSHKHKKPATKKAVAEADCPQGVAYDPFGGGGVFSL